MTRKNLTAGEKMKIQELEYIKKDMQNLYDAMDEKNPYDIYDILYRHQLEEIIGRLTFVIKNETGKLEMDAETAQVFKIITKNFEVRVSDS